MVGGVGGSGFDKWARFTQFGVRFMVKADFHGHGCRTAPMTSRVCRAGAPFGTSSYFAPGVVPCTNGVFPLCLLPICLLLYNIVPSCLHHTSNNKKHFRKDVKECRDVIVEKVYKQGRDGSVTHHIFDLIAPYIVVAYIHCNG